MRLRVRDRSASPIYKTGGSRSFFILNTVIVDLSSFFYEAGSLKLKSHLSLKGTGILSRINRHCACCDLSRLFL
jgi:hypothetical protein